MTQRINGVNVDGIEEIRDMFRKLPAQVGGKALKAALRNAAKDMFDEVRNRVPVDSGATKSSIKMTIPRTPDPDEIFVYIHTAYFVARFLENGTRRQPARPFMGPAYDAKIEDFVASFRQEAEKAIDRAVKKLGEPPLGGLTLGEFITKKKQTIARRRELNKAKGEFVKQKFGELRQQMGSRAFYRLSSDEQKAYRKQFLAEARTKLGHYKPKKTKKK